MFLNTVVFIGICIYTKLEKNMYLVIVLSCSLIENILNLIKNKLIFNHLIKKNNLKVS